MFKLAADAAFTICVMLFCRNGFTPFVICMILYFIVLAYTIRFMRVGVNIYIFTSVIMLGVFIGNYLVAAITVITCFATSCHRIII